MSIILTRDQVRLVDQLAIQRFGMSGLVLMENAGRNAAEIIRRSYGDIGEAVILCGSGNNGGDGFVIARHLHDSGWSVWSILVGNEASLTEDTRANFGIARSMSLPIGSVHSPENIAGALKSLSASTVVIDALLGTGFRGDVRSPLAELIRVVNDAPRRATVAIDVPSGLDCDTGEPSHATIRADLTITFVALKRGFLKPGAAAYLGRVEVADIGAPRELIERIAAGKETP